MTKKERKIGAKPNNHKIYKTMKHNHLRFEKQVAFHEDIVLYSVTVSAKRCSIIYLLWP